MSLGPNRHWTLDCGLWTVDSPLFARQIVLRHFIKHGAARVAHGIMYEADMRAPTCSPFVNRIQFCLSLLRSPELTEVVIVIAQRRKFFAQLAGTHIAVIVNHSRRLASRAGERPGGRLLKVSVLRSVVCRD